MIIGDGDPDQVAMLNSLARKQGVSDRVALLGYHDNPFSILSRADLFVSASRWEGASNALIEALACGLPIVATDCPTGNREVIEAGDCGTLAPVEDAVGLAAAIRIELDAKRPKAKQRLKAHTWSLDQCMENWVKLLSGRFQRRVDPILSQFANAGKHP
jgi:glycosyltransferase involved in cell wall biosynthesis